MSRDKQIEEMAKELCDATQKTNQRCNSICYPRGMCAHCKVMAEHLYTAGYRKSSEVAEEIFAEIEQVMISLDRRYMASGNPKQSWAVRGAMTEIAELKKKYIGKDTNVTTNTEN